MQKTLSETIDSIIITKKESGQLVEAESNNVVIASVSNEEIIIHNDYEIKIVPAEND